MAIMVNDIKKLIAPIHRKLMTHERLSAYFMMAKDSSFWREIHRVGKWAFLQKVMPFTLVSYSRVSSLYDQARAIEADKLPGAFVECGVWRGGCSLVLAQIAREGGEHRKTYLFDSFEGMPEPSQQDGEAARRFAGGKNGGRLEPIGRVAISLDEVSRLVFDQFAFDEADVLLYKGWFQQTLPPLRESIGPIALLRLDGDWYDSTRTCFENLYDNVIEGGVVVVDDYGHWEGCRKATDEFLQARGIKVDLRFIDYTGVYFHKPASSRPM